MSGGSGGSNGKEASEEDDSELRRGPWTIEEDSMLIHYIACNGEGRWNMLAKCAGLKRTGKSCRLRWLNYLKPDVKRGNLSPQEQLLILELHAKWGNRWSKIAQHLPGRTDNEIKNFWRTRVQKQARLVSNLEQDSQQQQLASAICQNAASNSSISMSAYEVENNVVPVSASPPSHWHNIFSPPGLGESSSSSFRQVLVDQNLGINNNNNSSNPFQDEDCYYVGTAHQASASGGFGLGDGNVATRCQVPKSDWVMDDEMANSVWNSSDEFWQFR